MVKGACLISGSGMISGERSGSRLIRFEIGGSARAALHTAQWSFRLPWDHTVHATHLCFSLPCGQGLHAAQLYFSLPWGQGLHSAQLLFRLPWRNGLNSSHPALTLPCGHGLRPAIIHLCAHASALCEPRRAKTES